MMPSTFIPLLAANELVVFALPVVGSMLLFYGIYQVMVETRSQKRKKIEGRLQERKTGAADGAANITRRGAMGEAKGFADSVMGKFKFVPKLQTKLDQADLHWSAAQTLLNLVAAAALTTVGLFVFQVNLVIAALCGLGVFGMPLIWINMRRKRRMAKLENQLPDVFDMMGQALRAGHSLGGAIQLIYEQMPPPVSSEFAQVYHEQNLGVKIEDALQAMANRVDSLDVRFFVTAVNIQRQTGGDLAEVLDNISGVIRERIELRGLVRGLTAEGRLSGWVLFALPAVVFAGSLVLNPDYGMVLLEDPIGQIMLMVALGLQLMGIAMIRWIVNIKV